MATAAVARMGVLVTAGMGSATAGHRFSSTVRPRRDFLGECRDRNLRGRHRKIRVVDAGEMTRVLVPITSLLSAVATFSGRGMRTRSRLAKDLEIAERLPRGTAKQFLLDFAQEQTVRYVARERRHALLWLTVVLFAGGAVCAGLLADFVTPWVGDSSIGNIIKVAMGLLLGAGAAAIAELPSFRKKQGKHTENSVVRLSLTA